MATPQIAKTETPYTEAPASWNTRYVTPGGFIWQITLRGESGKDLLERANVALNWLMENNFMPCENTYKAKFDGKKSNVIACNSTRVEKPLIAFQPDKTGFIQLFTGGGIAHRSRCAASEL